MQTNWLNRGISLNESELDDSARQLTKTKTIGLHVQLDEELYNWAKRQALEQEITLKTFIKRLILKEKNKI